jgi:uncharacterized membrane protein YdjX (TVP38/TMEM64 family)
MSGWLRGLVALAILVVAGFLLQALAAQIGIDRAWVDASVRGQGVRGELLFLFAGAAAIALGMPRQSLCFLGGYAFGFLGGSALGLLATSLGSVVAFYYARLLAGDYVRARFGRRLRALDARLSAEPFLAALTVRLLPVGNNLLTNLAAGVASVPAPRFFAGSVLGYVPQTLVFALAGSGIAIDPAERIVLSMVLFIATGLLGLWLYRRSPQRVPAPTP